MKLPEFIKQIQYAYQRVTRGYSDRDCWNIDHYFMEVIPPMLRHMKDHGVAYPGQGVEGGETPEEWAKTLELMASKIEAFQVFENAYWDSDKPFNQAEYNTAVKKAMDETTEGLKMFTTYFFSLWD